MLAIALACRPRLLIADEPTTALDATTQMEILALLRRLRAELDMSLLVISHDLGLLRWNCDRVYVMYAGHTVEHGPTERVLTAADASLHAGPDRGVAPGTWGGRPLRHDRRRCADDGSS